MCLVVELSSWNKWCDSTFGRHDQNGEVKYIWIVFYEDIE